MKIELLQNAFRGDPSHGIIASSLQSNAPRKRRQLPVASAHFDTVNECIGEDHESILIMAAENFDLFHLTRESAEWIVELLHDGKLLTKSDSEFVCKLLRKWRPLRETIDLISFVRLAVPEDACKARVLALLNQIVALRFREAS